MRGILVFSVLAMLLTASCGRIADQEAMMGSKVQQTAPSKACKGLMRNINLYMVLTAGYAFDLGQPAGTIRVYYSQMLTGSACTKSYYQCVREASALKKQKSKFLNAYCRVE